MANIPDSQVEWQPKRTIRVAESLIAFLSLFALFAVMTAILFWQWMPHLHSALIGPPEDNMQDFWNTWYAIVVRNPDNFFYQNDTLSGRYITILSFICLSESFAVALLSKFTGTKLSSLLFLQNISLLISFPLAGVGAFYLVRYFTQNEASALAGAFVFTFNPSHVAHVMHHAGVSSIEFIPFFVLSYLQAIERKSITWLGLAVGFFVLSALSCWYYLFYIAYYMAFHATYMVIRNHAFPSGWNLFTPLVCLAGALVVLSPLLGPMAREAMGPIPVYVGGSNFFVADVLGYVVFPPVHLFGDFTKYVNSQLTGDPWEATVVCRGSTDSTRFLSVSSHPHSSVVFSRPSAHPRRSRTEFRCSELARRSNRERSVYASANLSWPADCSGPNLTRRGCHAPGSFGNTRPPGPTASAYLRKGQIHHYHYLSPLGRAFLVAQAGRPSG